ncbi:phosphoglycerate mutase family protein [Luteimonas vadosa]|uniref:Phosphoglycerate mutase family protein n=1 Tax=Luteimonas vadosa TaxID=1165507 RepID=A0ABP9DZV4_9GAMM
MPRTALLFAASLLLAAAGCAALPVAPAPAATFVVVRHAEKAADDPSDPVLAEAGRQRAAALAASLADEPVVAVYSTDYRRTRQTAAPVAARHGLEVRPYDATQPADTFARELRNRHPAGTVVVVGHSNTVPAIVSALCACTVAAMDESEYDNRYTVRFGEDGRARLVHARDGDRPR